MTSDDRYSHRAYAGHEPSEAHTTADPIDLGAPGDLIGPPEPMSIEAVLAAPDGGSVRSARDESRSLTVRLSSVPGSPCRMDAGLHAVRAGHRAHSTNN
jgi:hypothetical protein